MELTNKEVVSSTSRPQIDENARPYEVFFLVIF